MIEVSDVDIKEHPSRAQTTDEYSLRVPQKIGGFGSVSGIRQRPGNIVANARKELESLQKSTLPQSRMSLDGPPRQMTAHLVDNISRQQSLGNAVSAKVPSIKSLSLRGPSDKISLYRNDEERQSVMKLITDQQANYQRLLAKQRPGHPVASQAIPIKPKSVLEQKNYGAFQKAAPIAPKQRRVSILKQ